MNVQSYAQKAFEGGILNEIKEGYKYSEIQLGFWRLSGAETAIRRHIENSDKMKYIAVLKLISAYNSDPREKLTATARENLNVNIDVMREMTV